MNDPRSSAGAPPAAATPSQIPAAGKAAAKAGGKTKRPSPAILKFTLPATPPILERLRRISHKTGVPLESAAADLLENLELGEGQCREFEACPPGAPALAASDAAAAESAATLKVPATRKLYRRLHELAQRCGLSRGEVAAEIIARTPNDPPALEQAAQKLRSLAAHAEDPALMAGKLAQASPPAAK